MQDQKIIAFGQEITDGDAQNFLKSFGLPKPCEVCRNTQWAVTMKPPAADEYLSLRSSKFDGSLGANAVPVFSTNCTRCGLMRIHSLSHLAEWIKNGSAPAV